MKKITAKQQGHCLHSVKELFATANLYQPHVVDNRRKKEPFHLRPALERLINCVHTYEVDHFVIKECASRRFPGSLDLNQLCEYAYELSGNKITFEVVEYTEKSMAA